MTPMPSPCVEAVATGTQLFEQWIFGLRGKLTPTPFAGQVECLTFPSRHAPFQ